MLDIDETLPIELWEESEGRWAFKVGAVLQMWDPDAPGGTPMDELRAAECAKMIQARLAGV